MIPFIKRLRIKNFKSLVDVEIHNIPAFAVFAGPNGAGKSNFFEALKFVNHFVRFGIREALRLHGGYHNIQPFKASKNNAHTFEFEIETHQDISLQIQGEQFDFHSFRYALAIENLDTEPMIDENIWCDQKRIVSKYGNNSVVVVSSREKNFLQTFSIIPSSESSEYKQYTPPVVGELSILQTTYFPETFLSNIRRLQIDPMSAKSSNFLQDDNSELDENARNLSSVLARIESNDKIRNTIVDMLSLIAPSLEKIGVHQERLRAANHITIKERGIKRAFPANLISDGTMYALALLVHILDRRIEKTWSLIEEPERGLHPKAIAEMIDFMRSNITADESAVLQPIWLTTHSATVVQHCNAGELWFIEKEHGKTIIRQADIDPQSRLPLDESWLSNALDGGLPW